MGTHVLADPHAALFQDVKHVSGQAAVGWTAVTSFSPLELDAGVSVFDAETGTTTSRRDFLGGVGHRMEAIEAVEDGFTAVLLADEELSWLELSRNLDTTHEAMVPSSVAAFGAQAQQPVRLIDDSEGQVIVYVDGDGELVFTRINCG